MKAKEILDAQKEKESQIESVEAIKLQSPEPRNTSNITGNTASSKKCDDVAQDQTLFENFKAPFDFDDDHDSSKMSDLTYSQKRNINL